ncbi:MAG: hypothetical protein ACPGN3_18220 [Opitutales bacterium]
MSESQEQLVDVKKWSICVVLTIAFWAFMTSMMVPFIPEESEGWTMFWAAFTAFPIAGTFYMASMCFTATLVDQLRRKGA